MHKKLNILTIFIFYLISFIYMEGASAASDQSNLVESKEIIDTWILDGKADFVIEGKYEIKLTSSKPTQMTIWSPMVYKGPVEIEFDCLVPVPNTKLLLLVYGYGIDGKPIWEWNRNGSYDDYNAGIMEVYTIAFNRGKHTYKKYGDAFANVRRIGGPQFAEYTMANFRSHRRKSDKEGKLFWQKWNTLSLLGAAREPASGQGAYFHYSIEIDPPHLRLEVEDIPFADIVDHRPNPLQKGSIGFRCMSKGKTFYIKNLVIKGLVVETKNP